MGFAAALLAILALAGIFVYARVSTELTSGIDDGLDARTADIAALVARGQAGEPDLTGGLFGSEEGFSQILRPGGAVVASTFPRGAGPAIEPRLVRDASKHPIRVDLDGVPGLEGSARIRALAARGPNGTFVVVAGTSTNNRDEALAGIAHAFLLGAPLALLIASGLGYLLASRSLAPVERMRSRAGQITLEHSGDRLPLPVARDEIHRLGDTLNTMLDRIEASLQRQRVFVADASHELRTPLAVLRTELELARSPGRSEDELRTAISSASGEVERLSRLADDLLVVARSDQGRLPIKRDPVDVDELVRRVTGRFEGRAREADREISVEVKPGLRATVDALRLEQALGNLIDNALSHGRGAVRVSARGGDGQMTFEVADEGPGFPPEFTDSAFERFTRSEEGRTGSGAGLGLAIVRAIATGHGGGAEIAATDPGGPAATVQVTIPDEGG